MWKFIGVQLCDMMVSFENCTLGCICVVYVLYIKRLHQFLLKEIMFLVTYIIVLCLLFKVFLIVYHQIKCPQT